MNNYLDNADLNIPPGVVDPADIKDYKPKGDLVLIKHSLECRSHSTPRKGSIPFHSFSALDNYEAKGE